MNSSTEKIKEEFAKRIHKAMDDKNYPVRGRARVLSREFDVSDKGAGKWLKGEAIPETSKIPLLADFLGVSAEWLLNGTGDSEQKTYVGEVFGNVRPSERILRKIPVLDFVQAGAWREVAYDGLNPKSETYTTYEGINPKAVFSLIVDGMSMAPEFKPGDEIVVDAAKVPVPGSLVVAQEIQHGSALTTFKKYRVIGINEHGVDIIELVPLNPDYPTYNSTQIEISIIGVVVQHHREFKY